MQREDEFLDRDGYLELFDAIASDDKRLHANPGLHEVPPEELIFSFEFMKSHIEGVAIRPGGESPGSVANGPVSCFYPVGLENRRKVRGSQALPPRRHLDRAMTRIALSSP